MCREPRPGEEVAAERTLGDHVIRVVKLLHAGRHRMPRPHPDVDPLTYPLLFQIAREQCRISDLAAMFQSELSTVSRQVSSLVDLGLVSKEPDPRDRRAQVLALTEDGCALLRDIRALRDAWINALLADWTETDRELLASLLARFGDAVESHTLALEIPDS